MYVKPAAWIKRMFINNQLFRTDCPFSRSLPNNGHEYKQKLKDRHVRAMRDVKDVHWVDVCMYYSVCNEW